MDDIYGDLEHFDLGEEVEKVRLENSKLLEKISALENEKISFSTKYNALEKETKELRKNISSLHKTSCSEVQRKDKIIADLREQMDKLILRKNNRGSDINLAPCNTDNGGNLQKEDTNTNVPGNMDTANPPYYRRQNLDKSKIYQSRRMDSTPNVRNKMNKFDDNTNASCEPTFIQKPGRLPITSNANKPYDGDRSLPENQNLHPNIREIASPSIMRNENIKMNSNDQSQRSKEMIRKSFRDIEERRIRQTQMEFEKDYSEAEKQSTAKSFERRAFPSSPSRFSQRNSESSRERETDMKRDKNSYSKPGSTERFSRRGAKRSHSPYRSKDRRSYRVRSRSRSRNRKKMRHDNSHRSDEYYRSKHRGDENRHFSVKDSWDSDEIDNCSKKYNRFDDHQGESKSNRASLNSTNCMIKADNQSAPKLSSNSTCKQNVSNTVTEQIEMENILNIESSDGENKIIEENIKCVPQTDIDSNNRKTKYLPYDFSEKEDGEILDMDTGDKTAANPESKIDISTQNVCDIPHDSISLERENCNTSIAVDSQTPTGSILQSNQKKKCHKSDKKFLTKRPRIVKFYTSEIPKTPTDTSKKSVDILYPKNITEKIDSKKKRSDNETALIDTEKKSKADKDTSKESELDTKRKSGSTTEDLFGNVTNTNSATNKPILDFMNAIDDRSKSCNSSVAEAATEIPHKISENQKKLHSKHNKIETKKNHSDTTKVGDVIDNKNIDSYEKSHSDKSGPTHSTKKSSDISANEITTDKPLIKISDSHKKSHSTFKNIIDEEKNKTDDVNMTKEILPTKTSSTHKKTHSSSKTLTLDTKSNVTVSKEILDDKKNGSHNLSHSASRNVIVETINLTDDNISVTNELSNTKKSDSHKKTHSASKSVTQDTKNKSDNVSVSKELSDSKTNEGHQKSQSAKKSETFDTKNKIDNISVITEVLEKKTSDGNKKLHSTSKSVRQDTINKSDDDSVSKEPSDSKTNDGHKKSHSEKKIEIFDTKNKIDNTLVITEIVENKTSDSNKKLHTSSKSVRQDTINKSDDFSVSKELSDSKTNDDHKKSHSAKKSEILDTKNKIDRILVTAEVLESKTSDSRKKTHSTSKNTIDKNIKTSGDVSMTEKVSNSKINDSKKKSHSATKSDSKNKSNVSVTKELTDTKSNDTHKKSHSSTIASKRKSSDSAHSKGLPAILENNVSDNSLASDSTPNKSIDVDKEPHTPDDSKISKSSKASEIVNTKSNTDTNTIHIKIIRRKTVIKKS